MADNTYWEEIERYFSKKRGQALILSPKDWPLVTAWQERGIPVDIVCQGIDRTFARIEEQFPNQTRRKIRGLSSCQHDVEALWPDQREASQPSSSQPSENEGQTSNPAEQQRIQTKLRSVSAQLRKLAQNTLYVSIHPKLTTTAEEIDVLLPLIGQAADDVTLAQIKQRLRQVEHDLVDRLEETLTVEQRQALMVTAEAQVAAYKKRMKPQVYQETLQIAFLQALREAYPIPSFL